MVQLERVVKEYKNTSDKYILNSDDLCDAFQRQYFNSYTARLEVLKPRILEAAKPKGYDKAYQSLEDLNLNEKAFIIGTIEKRISFRPSVLKELAEDEKMIPDDLEVENEGDAPSLVSQKDFLEFEDEKQIVKLQGNVGMEDVATGCTVGLYGYQLKDDTFFVEDLIWPSIRPAPPLKPTRSGFIALISGLELTGKAELDKETVMAFTLFSRWLNGEFVLGQTKAVSPSDVERVLIVGDSISIPQNRGITSVAGYLRLEKNEAPLSFDNLLLFDKLLSELTSKMCVDVVPGVGDPTTQLWPQQAIHKACLSKSGVNGAALGLVTNPYEFTMDGLDFVVTSGQNVSDLRRLSSITSSCQLMELLLKWRHIAPTAPDTLDSFPFEGRDPLVIDKFPNVMITGNQPETELQMYSEDGKDQTLLVSLSRFSKTHTVAFLDLSTLQVSHHFFGSL